jgi:acyl-CoA reductase-like NAD-dependent aldehyde dehydrogenase
MTNAVIPALLAGNTILIKQAPQTFAAADFFITALQAAGLPKDVVQAVRCDHETCHEIMQIPAIQYVQFTGSVKGLLDVAHIFARRKAGSFIVDLSIYPLWLRTWREGSGVR